MKEGLTKIGLTVGSKLWFLGEKQGYTVRALGKRYAVCTKPMNAKKTVLYTVCDFQEWVRGTENLVFGMGAETDGQCREMIERLEVVSRDSQLATEVSHRNRVPMRIIRVNIL